MLNLYISNLEFLLTINDLDNQDNYITYDNNNKLKFDDRYFSSWRSNKTTETLDIIITSFFNVIRLNQIKKNKNIDLLQKSIQNLRIYAETNMFNNKNMVKINTISSNIDELTSSQIEEESPKKSGFKKFYTYLVNAISNAIFYIRDLFIRQ